MSKSVGVVIPPPTTERSHADATHADGNGRAEAQATGEGECGGEWGVSGTREERQKESHIGSGSSMLVGGDGDKFWKWI